MTNQEQKDEQPEELFKEIDFWPSDTDKHESLIQSIISFTKRHHTKKK